MKSRVTLKLVAHKPAGEIVTVVHAAPYGPQIVQTYESRVETFTYMATTTYRSKKRRA